MRFTFDGKKGLIQELDDSESPTVKVGNEPLETFVARYMVSASISGTNLGTGSLIFSGSSGDDPTTFKFFTVSGQGNVTVSNSGNHLIVSGTAGITTGALGRNATLFVDKTYGNDSTGARLTGHPFYTISAAMAAAIAGDVIVLSPGNYDETVIMKDGIAVRGVSLLNTKIRMLNVTASTDLVTMGNSTRLEDVALELTSQQHVTLRGVVYPNETMTTARLRTATVTVDNFSASLTGTSNVYGFHSSGSGYPEIGNDPARAVTVVVRSAGSGSKCGLLVDTPSRFGTRDVNYRCVLRSGSAGSAYGVETRHANAEARIRLSTISGSTADVSQTTGSLALGSCNLVNHTANGKGFETVFAPNSFVFADPGSLPSNTTRFLRPGSEAIDANEIKIRIPQKCIVKDLYIRARVAPGGSLVDTVVVRKNGVDTALSASLSGSQTSKLEDNISVNYNKGDDFSIKVVSATNTATQDIVVMVSLF